MGMSGKCEGKIDKECAKMGEQWVDKGVVSCDCGIVMVILHMLLRL
jgi:hypothetical protein